jgi:hypothetical protein
MRFLFAFGIKKGQRLAALANYWNHYSALKTRRQWRRIQDKEK